MAISFKAVVPARYSSSRLPAKPLADIAGLPMVVRVLQRAVASGAEEVWVATDHPDVAAAVRDAGGNVVMTRPDHPSGTDRLGEVVNKLGWSDDTVVVNVQGDEPLIDPVVVAGVAQSLLTDPDASIATAAHVVDSVDEFLNPAVVKVVCDQRGRALYFSRAPIPFPRDAAAAGLLQRGDALPAGLTPLRHIGLYAYRAGFLRAYASLAASPFEGVEMLEQLRALWHGYPIRVEILAEAPPAGVDTPADLERVRAHFARV